MYRAAKCLLAATAMTGHASALKFLAHSAAKCEIPENFAKMIVAMLKAEGNDKLPYGNRYQHEPKPYTQNPDIHDRKLNEERAGRTWAMWFSPQGKLVIQNMSDFWQRNDSNQVMLELDLKPEMFVPYTEKQQSGEPRFIHEASAINALQTLTDIHVSNFGDNENHEKCTQAMNYFKSMADEAMQAARIGLIPKNMAKLGAPAHLINESGPSGWYHHPSPGAMSGVRQVVPETQTLLPSAAPRPVVRARLPAMSTYMSSTLAKLVSKMLEKDILTLSQKSESPLNPIGSGGQMYARFMDTGKLTLYKYLSSHEMFGFVDVYLLGQGQGYRASTKEQTEKDLYDFQGNNTFHIIPQNTTVETAEDFLQEFEALATGLLAPAHPGAAEKQLSVVPELDGDVQVPVAPKTSLSEATPAAYEAGSPAYTPAVNVGPAQMAKAPTETSKVFLGPHPSNADVMPVVKQRTAEVPDSPTVRTILRTNGVVANPTSALASNIDRDQVEKAIAALEKQLHSLRTLLFLPRDQ